MTETIEAPTTTPDYAAVVKALGDPTDLGPETMDAATLAEMIADLVALTADPAGGEGGAEEEVPEPPPATET